MKRKTRRKVEGLTEEGEKHRGCADGMYWKPQVPGLWFALENEENDVRLDCGCVIHRCAENRVEFYACRHHDAADDLLEAAKAVMGLMRAVAPRGVTCKERDALEAAINKASDRGMRRRMNHDRLECR